MWLTTSRKDWQSIIHIDKGSRGLQHRRYEEIFYTIRGAAPRSSTSQTLGGKISCYFEFSSLQSLVVPVWDWLSLDVFEYRKFSPSEFQVRVGGRGRMRVRRSTAEDPGEDLHQRRATAESTHRWERIKKRTFIQRISERINSSTKGDQGMNLHRQRIQESFYIGKWRKGGHPLRHQDRQDLKYYQNQVVYFSLDKISQ